MSDQGLVPVFKTITIPNEAKSLKEGRPIFDEMEVVEIRFPGDRNRISVFPADAPSASEADSGLTYAQRFAKQYEQFKSSKTQTMSGTPLSEVPFLTEAKRAELKAQNVYTAEQLASLDGTPLKQLGMGGRELKNQATAYLQSAKEAAEPTAMAAEIEDLKARLAQYENVPQGDAQQDEIKADADEGGKDIDDCTDDELRAYIEKQTGEAPHHRTGREKLLSQAHELAKAE